jgi:hypothetical protein
MLSTIRKIFDFGKRKLIERPEKALYEAYDAALAIKIIENQHFNGDKISLLTTNSNNVSSKNLSDYFQSELTKNLRIIKLKLLEFEASVSLLDNLESSESHVVIDKLKFIDDVLVKYKSEQVELSGKIPFLKVLNSPTTEQPDAVDSSTQEKLKFNETSFVPRTILGTIDMIKKRLDPRNEKQLINDLRNSRVRTRIALIFLTLLIVIPLITQQVSKKFLISPLVDRFNLEGHIEVFLHGELQKEALEELEEFEKTLKFQQLIGEAPQLSIEKIEEMVKEKALEITKNYNEKSFDGVKNIFSDAFSIGAFGILIVIGKSGVTALKALMDDVMYGLSDSAKAFLLIVCTDIFVGFHSSHGWEVLLEGATRHFGLPENREFIFIFIATFPVILDAIFKYWIFRYLNRMSPSAVATYKNMNE